jgi:hypothetical protein
MKSGGRGEEWADGTRPWPIRWPRTGAGPLAVTERVKTLSRKQSLAEFPMGARIAEAEGVDELSLTSRYWSCALR